MTHDTAGLHQEKLDRASKSLEALTARQEILRGMSEIYDGASTCADVKSD